MGSTGAPLPSSTWVPALPRRSPPTVDIDAGGFGFSSATAGTDRETDNRDAEVINREVLTIR
ncbi:hypothetical protein GCM10010358_22400 [Streptomyces minutiscleroticus]|uniref:Uncharacterized protein n=1 Tax=Streptomyces minutiscleroticus TaxID=68238 RepID=A0A918NH93_9ACTN|nr:hypothetical protein GCM10010358_22400 [Streptomyces minutiscleroticus]